MTYTTLIKIAPVFTVERFDDPRWSSERTMYESGSLQFLPGRDSIPLIVNHDDERVIGTVHELFRMEWTDGPWIAARCTVDDPPAWMKCHTRASFGFKSLHRRELKLHGIEADVIARALVTEVSVLPESVEPAEPLACVLSLRRADELPERVAASGPVMTGMIRRQLGEVLQVR